MGILMKNNPKGFITAVKSNDILIFTRLKEALDLISPFTFIDRFERIERIVIFKENDRYRHRLGRRRARIDLRECEAELFEFERQFAHLLLFNITNHIEIL